MHYGSEIKKLIEKFQKDMNGDLSLLPDDELTLLAKHYIAVGLLDMPIKERAWVFYTELSSRMAARTANSSRELSKTSVCLAGVAICVGVVQVILVGVQIYIAKHP